MFKTKRIVKRNGRYYCQARYRFWQDWMTLWEDGAEWRYLPPGTYHYHASFFRQEEATKCMARYLGEKDKTEFEVIWSE